MCGEQSGSGSRGSSRLHVCWKWCGCRPWGRKDRCRSAVMRWGRGRWSHGSYLLVSGRRHVHRRRRRHYRGGGGGCRGCCSCRVEVCLVLVVRRGCCGRDWRMRQPRLRVVVVVSRCHLLGCHRSRSPLDAHHMLLLLLLLLLVMVLVMMLLR